MRKRNERYFEWLRNRVPRLERAPGLRGWTVIALAVAIAFWAVPAPAQTSAHAQSASKPAPQKHRKPPAAKTQPVKAGTAAAAGTPAAETPRPPELPKWPINDKPTPAKVTWDSQGLRIDAVNSSLMQILLDVQTATGSQIEGVSSDQRIFGIYGPGLARDVLSQLLSGTDYNVLMVGDLGKGAPRQVILTARNGEAPRGPAIQNRGNSGDEDAADSDADEPPQYQPPGGQPAVPGSPVGGPPRNPQQIMQEMQQRQQGARPNPQ